MPVNLVGNINGNTYNAPDINLFEAAKKQNNQPVKFSDTKAGENIPFIKVNISEEGLRALHGSRLEGSMDLDKARDERKYIIEHQPIESFYNRFANIMQKGYEEWQEENPVGTITLEDKADILMEGYYAIYDEVSSGYDAGTRIRFLETPESEDGFIRLSKEDELAILENEFKEFVNDRFGSRHQEESKKVAKALNHNIRHYEPEKIPDDFVERLLKSAKDYAEKYKEQIY